jgi:hypothetical protein
VINCKWLIDVLSEIAGMKGRHGCRTHVLAAILMD